MVFHPQQSLSADPFSVIERFIPALFVVIWSTGWIVAKYVAVAQVDPLTFLSLRYLSAGVVITFFAVFMGANWPKTTREWQHAMLSGVFLHAIYLGGVWWAIAEGVPAGVSALIAALQPLLTALFARRLLGENMSPMNMAGVLVGFLGVVLVLTPKFYGVESRDIVRLALPLLVNLVATLSVTIGTFYQKRYCATGDLRTSVAIQYLGALVVTLPVAALLEPMHIPLVREVLYGLLWSVLVLSIGAISLMLIMIRRGAVSKVASLIYMIPPTAALQAWLMFGETLSVLQIAGMGLTALGVYLATRK